MAILKDAILSIVIAVVAIIGVEALGWAWYILGLLWLGQRARPLQPASSWDVNDNALSLPR